MESNWSNLAGKIAVRIGITGPPHGSKIEALKKIWLEPCRGFLSDEFYNKRLWSPDAADTRVRVVEAARHNQLLGPAAALR